MLKSKLAAGLIPYVPGEQPKGGAVIKLNTNENPYPPSPQAIAALRAFDADRLRLYPDPTADALRAAISRTEGVRTENVFVGNGSDEVLSLAFAAYFDGQGAPVLFPDVTYSFYRVFCSLYGIRYEEIPLRDDFSVDPADYMGKSACGIVLANPNAPTSMTLCASSVRAMIEAYPDNVFICDEAYVDFSSRPSLTPLTAEYKNLLIVKTFSKSRSLAGGRCGYAVGDKDLIDTLRCVKDCFNSYTVNAVTAAVARAAVLDTDYFDRCVSRIRQTREKTRTALEHLGFRVLDSDANFLFAMTPALSGKTLQDELRARGIIVRRFDHARIADWNRITVGTEEDMETFVSACADILAGKRNNP